MPRPTAVAAFAIATVFFGPGLDAGLFVRPAAAATPTHQITTPVADVTTIDVGRSFTIGAAAR